jgi:two-component system, OmpR family, response regulator
MLAVTGIPTMAEFLCERKMRRGLTSRVSCILNVHDDPSIQRQLSEFLSKHNMRVVPAQQWQDLVRQITANQPDLLLLHLPLRNKVDLEVLREIRARTDTPIIITKARPAGEIDRVAALELGADDYLTQPFGPRELLARIRAVLRRHETGRIVALQVADRGRYRFDGWLLDRGTRKLADPDGNHVALTKREYALLTAFLDAPQRPLSREHLLQATRVHEDVFDRAIDVQILRLRRKLERGSAGRTSIIETERGVGYIFLPPVEIL